MDRTEFRCSLCSTIIGRNLRGEYPFALERQHMQIHAAAPALLEALEALEEVIRQNPHLSGERLARVTEMKDARAAIAQAKGERQ